MDRFDERTLDDLEAAKSGSYGQRAQQEARLDEADQAVREAHPLTYSTLFCARGWPIHLAAAWFSVAANVTIRGYLGEGSNWDKWVNLDLAFTCFWAVLMTALPIAVITIRTMRWPHPRRGLSFRY